MTSLYCNAAFKTSKRQHFCHITILRYPKCKTISSLISRYQYNIDILPSPNKWLPPNPPNRTPHPVSTQESHYNHTGSHPPPSPILSVTAIRSTLQIPICNEKHKKNPSSPLPSPHWTAIHRQHPTAPFWLLLNCFSILHSLFVLSIILLCF